MQDQPDVLTDEIHLPKIRRRKLLPLWIKVFMWIFIAFAIIAPISVAFALMGYTFNIALYGLKTSEPLSLTGLLLIAIFGLKGIVSLGLLKEKDWAINLGIIDAILGIVICVFINYIHPFLNSDAGLSVSLFQLELLFLIPYLIKLIKIKNQWDHIEPKV